MARRTDDLTPDPGRAVRGRGDESTSRQSTKADRSTAPDRSTASAQSGKAARAAKAGVARTRLASFDAAGDTFHRAVYVISVAAELAGVHPQTLRVYERKGLVDPSRTGGGNRRYSQADIERLRRIGSLTAAGLNLEGVRRVLELEAQVERLAVELERVRTEARDALERTHRQYRRDLVPLRQSAVAWPPTGPPGPRR